MTAITVPPHGPTPAKVLVIGEFPTVDDERRAKLNSGNQGTEFHKMLHEAGFIVTELRYTTLLQRRPYNSQMRYEWTKDSADAKMCMPTVKKRGDVWCKEEFIKECGHVWEEIRECNPNVIITLGEAPLWYITGELSVSKWRGSLLTSFANGGRSVKVIPTYSPGQTQRMWEWRAYTVRDLQRAFAEMDFPEIRQPKYNFLVAPTYYQARGALGRLLAKAEYSPTPVKVAADIETISRNIACIGFAWSRLDAICIPLMDERHTHFYDLDEEVGLVLLTKKLLTHPNVKVIWQNGSYDIQHIIRSWLFRAKSDFDTMLAQHILFPGLPKDLGFLASMYCEYYVYWKDELTDYRSLPKDLIKFWTYNCKDNVNTFEIAEVLEGLVEQLGFVEQNEFLHRLNHHVNTMMVEGVAIDKKEKSRLADALLPEIGDRELEIAFLAGRDINIGSPKQMKEFFYDELKQKEVLHKKTHKPTTDDNALTVFAQREPILRPLVKLISEARSIGVFYSTFVMMKLDADGRMRSNFNVAGTETYRFSSSKNPFGTGGNMQNWPKGSEDSELDEDEFNFPNLRKMVIPDCGYEMFDVDLAGADAQIVAWEAEDDDLKAKFRSGEKIHALNAKDIYGRDAGPDGKRAPYYKKAKMGTHLSNYGGRPPTLSKALGMTIHEAEAFQKRWFQMHPGIKQWHREVENSLMTTRSVRNKFGFRRFYLDRIEGLLPQALAWIPQSSIAIVISKGLVNIAESGSSMKVNIQVHDSLVGQYPKTERFLNLPILRRCLQITVPYTDPLIIGTSLDLSTKSWGDLVSFKWSSIEE